MAIGDKLETGVFVVAQLNARLRPLDRGDIYEDPLDAFLNQEGLGEVTGGGSLQGATGEIMHCNIDIELSHGGAEALMPVKKKLEALGAPKSSFLIVDSNHKIPIGKNEGLAVYLNGTDLEDNVYEECDINIVWSRFEEQLGSDGRIHSYWEGPKETALYIYGPSYETMVERIWSFLGSYPLCEKARLEKIA